MKSTVCQVSDNCGNFYKKGMPYCIVPCTDQWNGLYYLLA